MWLRLLLVATVFFVACGFSSPTEGQQLMIGGAADRINPQLGAYVENVEPGDKRSYTVDVTNPTATEIKALLYTADAIPALGGGKDFTLPSDEDFGAAAWYTTPDRTITLKPGEIRTYTLDMQVPETLQPGQYISVIGVYDDHEKAVDTKEQAQARFVTNIVRKTGLQVVLSYKMEEADAPEAVPIGVAYAKESGEAFLSVLLANEGDSLSKPHMSVQVKQQDAIEIPLFDLEITFDSIYAGTVAQYRAELSGPLSPGLYVADVTAKLGNHEEKKQFPFEVASEETRSHWATASSGDVVQVAEDGSPLHADFLGLPPAFLYGGLLLLLFIAILALRLVSKKRRDKRP